MPYSYISLSQAVVQLAERLGDYNLVHWTNSDPTYPELSLYVKEAIYCWQAMTFYWRDRDTFNTANGTAFYDLTNVLTHSLLKPTLKDRDIIAALLYHLLEAPGDPSTTPLNVSAWAGSDAFTLDDLTQAIQRRRDQFLMETGMLLTRSTLSSGPSPVSLVSLPDNIIDVRRVAWMDISGVYTHLWRSDEWSANAYKVGWTNTPSAMPSAYSVAVVPPLTIQVIPPVSNNGTVELLTVQAGAPLDPTVGVLLGVPDNFAWVIKWGALADLLGRDGQSRDPVRMIYAEQRWKQGVALARMSTSVVQAYLQGLSLFADSLHALDSQRVGWQNSQGQPDFAGLASWNLMALSKVPDAGAYSIMVDVVRNAPVPLAAGDFLQAGREELDAILDYAQHLAAFKEGGAEFQATVPQFQRMMRLALLKNERLKASIPQSSAFRGLVALEEKQRPRREMAPEAQLVEEA